MKKSKLNGFNVKQSRRGFLAKLLLIAIPILLLSFASTIDNGIPAIGRLAKADDDNHFLLFKEQIDENNDTTAIIDLYPCGTGFAISIEDERFFFCKNSSQIYTEATADSIPGSGKMSLPKELNLQQEVHQRINELNVFSYEGSNGQRWGIDKEQLKRNYPSSTKDIFLDGENKTAFNPENLMYEMLISIQKLSQENAALKIRLEALEKQKNGENSNINDLASMKIITNPITSNNLCIEYNIDSNIQNASLQIVSITGTKLYSFPINQRGLNQEQFTIDLPPSTYLCVLMANQQIANTQKFVVQ